MPRPCPSGAPPAADGSPAPPALGQRDMATLALGQHLESKCSCRWDRLDQAHKNFVAQPVGLAAAAADERVLLLHQMIEVADHRGCGDEPICPGVLEPYEEAEARDTRDASLELGTDPIGQMS